MAPDERNNDIISEQAFSKEQAKLLDDRRYKAVDAIEDRELADREPLQPLAAESSVDGLDSSVWPQADSPGDSEADATTEFLLGINFRPDGEDAFEDEEDDELEDFEGSDKTVYAEEKSASAGETPSLDVNNTKFETLTEEDLPPDARVVSAGRPSPRSDAGSPSSVN